MKEIRIIDFIPYGHDNAVTYSKLRRLTGMCKREIRAALSSTRKDFMILNMQDGKGFFRPIPEEEDGLITRFYRQENHRNNEHRETLRPLQNYMYMKGIE